MEQAGSPGFRVGITGGIGTGKSTVCRLFEALGVPVYDADYWAKWLLQHDKALKEGILNLFGPEAYTPQGEYNRAYIAQLVFQSPDKLAALNALSHPAVEQHATQWHEEKIGQGSPYTLKEAALMVESGSYRRLDFLIVVTAPEELRIRRVMERDGVAEEQVRARMRRQMPEAEKIALADALIENDGRQSLVQQVWRLHRLLLQKAADKKADTSP